MTDRRDLAPAISTSGIINSVDGLIEEQPFMFRTQKLLCFTDVSRSIVKLVVFLQQVVNAAQ